MVWRLLGGFALRYQTHIMYVFGQLYKCGCYWLLIREPPTQKEVCLPGDESGGVCVCVGVLGRV